MPLQPGPQGLIQVPIAEDEITGVGMVPACEPFPWETPQSSCWRRAEAVPRGDSLVSCNGCAAPGAFSPYGDVWVFAEGSSHTTAASDVGAIKGLFVCLSSCIQGARQQLCVCLYSVRFV